MSRSIWSGTIQFGLVTVPVQLLTAVKEKNISFHMMTPDGKCRLRRKLVCPDTGKEYDFKDTARAVEVAPGDYVIIDQKEVKKLKPEAGRTIDIHDFVELAQIDPVYYDRTYHLRPGEGGGKAFGLLVQAMEKTGRAAIATFVLRDRQHLATLRPHGALMALHTMFYADEVIDPGDAAGSPSKAAKPSPQELKVAEQLIDALAGDFEPAKYRDDYREKLEEMVRAKAEGEPIHVAPAPHRERIINLMDALKKSLETVDGSGRDGRGHDGHGRRNGHHTRAAASQSSRRKRAPVTRRRRSKTT